jgi:hypothetical protein
VGLRETETREEEPRKEKRDVPSSVGRKKGRKALEGIYIYR